MRNTAVRLSITFPQGYQVRWPDLCSVCGGQQVDGVAPVLRTAPPVPYCSACLGVHERCSRWIRNWLLFAFLFNIGPVLYMGATLDRALPSQNSYHNFSFHYMAFAFFVMVASASAAAVGYTRRSELQGVSLQQFTDSPLDDLRSSPLTEDPLFEVRFKNADFYSATLDANRTG